MKKKTRTKKIHTKKPRLFSLAALCVALPIACMAAFSGCETHTHTWGDWQRSEGEHWRVCEECDAEERGAHTGEPCADCGYGFKALAFGFTEGGDAAHADFAREANEWFAAQGEENGFTYDFAGSDFSLLNDDTLAGYDMVIFLNDRPHERSQQEAFERFMEGGGAWIGFHACAFSMVDSKEESEGYWSWYQDEFLACGNYARNTWNPTSEPLTVETHDHFSTKNLPDVFDSAPCEWYGWEYDLTQNEDITVLLTLNPTEENPAGDQPDPNKPHEIWREGHYPIAWANDGYNMLYTNMGHNLQSYNDFEKESETFSRPEQCRFILDAMYGLVLGG